ncbi:DNA translocase FtsK [Falsibacillus pallidus]|uniref:S-DNA-T family DNA segregation ATPase FtsK/SpoIIIE n=1 Tax=Falsibacillus pallidus TaxID=493781 RepID=A0A370GQS2_9BACI|nr:DNA translocase FtsK [Falsibacillus pallidus]RDI44313.1 S-DNA-T family DNA segregation ATPase FtsK/SpoIIIE [Falsibacillus pallidus]
MSWFKKIAKILKSDENIEGEYEHITHESSELPSQMEGPQRASKGKEIETRMTYQYPKGEFRFPLIPDQGKAREQRRQQMRQQPVEKQDVRLKKEKPLPKGLEKQKEKLPVKDEPSRNEQHNHTSRPTIKPKLSRPFTPTEIPSPIYGFNRPKPNEKVEIELSGIKTVTAAITNNIDIPSSLFKKEEEISPAMEHTPLPILEKTEAADINLKETDEIIEAREEPEEQVTSVEETIIEPQMESFESEILEDKEILKVEDTQEINEEVEQASEDIEDHSFVQQAMQSTETSAALEAEEETEAVERIEEVRQEEQKKRSHLPFNVIMTKQDRTKYEQKKSVGMVRPSIEASIKDEPVPCVMEEKKPAVEEVLSGSVENDKGLSNGYSLPPYEYLNPPVDEEPSDDWLRQQSELLNETLANFNVQAQVVNVTQGPAVTRFEVQPAPGVKVNKITNLSDDIKLSLAAKDIRIEAPIPGKHTIGIEVPNKSGRPVWISEIISSPAFQESSSPLTAALGLDISGNPIVTDLKKMPHGLIAGATGSGKSVCINSILLSLLYKAKPHELKLLLIDPKMVELAPYNHIPHLVSPVITDVKAATGALKWAVEEMERRYQLFAHAGARDITRFNDLAEKNKQYSDKLPYIVIVIDELADLMMMSPADVEEAICRIAQKARACGIHLIIATQRPSVDVITGLIKANVPTRIAFSVSSQIDSRTIIDISGAEKLLGKGDMLFLENGASKPFRLQGTFVSDDEIDMIVDHVRSQQEPDYLFEQEELLKKTQVVEEEDPLFFEACEFIVDQGGASTSSLQRRFHIGYNRAARLIDLLEKQGIISESRGTKPRDVLISEGELESIQDTSPSL